MGYYTRFELEVYQEPEGFDPDMLDLFMMKEQKKNDNFIYTFKCIDGSFEDQMGETKWYEFDEDMKVLAKKFPDVVFKLSGEGEETGDIWNKYYKGDKSQDAKVVITIEEFDENKLV